MPNEAQTTGFNLINLFDILVDPGSVAQKLNRNAAWLYPLLIVGLGEIALGMANLPLIAQLVEANLPAGLSSEQMGQTMSSFLRYQKAGVFIAPLTLLLKWASSAWVLFMSCVIMEISASFKNLFALLAQCSLVIFLQDLTIYTIIHLKGDQVRDIADLTPKLGLDLILTGFSKPMMAMISYFSVFNIWYLIVLTLGLSFLGKCSKGRAFIAVIPIWALQLCFIVGLAWLG